MYDLELKNFWDYHLVRDHDMEQSELKGMLKGRLEGKLEGKLEGNLENARAMKKEGLSNELIAKITKLSIEEIGKL